MAKWIVALLGAAGILVLAFVIGWGAVGFIVQPPGWSVPPAAAPAEPARGREPCADNDPLRKAYFGDLHVHTAYSYDGSGRGLRTTPDQAYRFARGERIGLPPYDARGVGKRTVQLDRPLDFAAVTDHAEAIGEVFLCITPGTPGYEGDRCRAFRGEQRFGWLPKSISSMVAMRGGLRADDLCGEDGGTCRDALVSAWRSIGDAAEQWYDRSESCEFTTFHGYEYSYAPMGNRAHRNVIFRNEVVPELPISTIDEPEPEGLWRRLRELCHATAGDCDVLAIPHNPNHSSGRMFALSDPAEPLETRRERANLRAALEPLVEMTQVKGESECRNGLWGVIGEPDELCDLEKYEPIGEAKDCEGGLGFGKVLGLGCVARTDFARYSVAAGLLEAQRLGVNPFRVGFIGSTDTHNGTPGDVEEWSFDGSRALNDADPVKRLNADANRNPGGLVGVWAEENSRDALFDAMRRRETFATSGPRMTVRLFGGWGGFSNLLGETWCDREDAIEAGYAEGVPMGSVLPSQEAVAPGAAPTFAVWATRDPGTPDRPGGLLQKVQIIKVWADANGVFHDAVFDVAGGANDAGVDPSSCAATGEGADSLCAVWRDPRFVPSVAAAYYARVVENPSCKWTEWHCLALPPEERPQACRAEDRPRTIRERAWSSPIWYAPPMEGVRKDQADEAAHRQSKHRNQRHSPRSWGGEVS